MEFTAISRLEKGKLVVEVNAPQADKTTQYAYYLCEKTEGCWSSRCISAKAPSPLTCRAADGIM